MLRKRMKIAIIMLIVLFLFYLTLQYSAFLLTEQNIILASSLATVVMAILTFFIVLFAWLEIRELRLSREAETRPYVIVDFDIPYGTQLIELVVKNVGSGLAKDIHFKFNPSIIDTSSRVVSDLPLFKNGLEFLAPGKEIRQFFDTAIQYFNEKKGMPMAFDVELSYCGIDPNKKYKEKTRLDLSTYKNLRVITKKGLKDLVKILKDIKRSLDKIKEHLSQMAKK